MDKDLEKVTASTGKGGAWSVRLACRWCQARRLPNKGNDNAAMTWAHAQDRE